MKVYNYHPITNEYIGPSIADESPLEPGVYHIPGFATVVEPLQPKDDYAIVFNTESNVWNYIELPPVLVEEVVEEPVIENGPLDPVDKLKEFLSQNPDVAELLK